MNLECGNFNKFKFKTQSIQSDKQKKNNRRT